MSARRRAGDLAWTASTADMVATSCGTAVAAVCALGLFQIERLLAGVWSVAAVLTAGCVCAMLARTFARLAAVIPSGASLLAYLSRGFGRRAGVAIAVPYLLLTLFLVGAEATVVGLVVARLAPVPAPAASLVFLVGTWLLCRAGIQVGYRVQALATWALLVGLGALSLQPIAAAAWRGDLAARLLPPAPPAVDFVAGVGLAIFLFMGFELITTQVEVSSTAVVGKALRVSVAVLTAFYALVSIGFSCMAVAPRELTSGFVPQLALAEQAGGAGALALVALLTVLASFTSFNGALLSLSRFAYALAAQGALPRRLARVEPRSLVPRGAMSALLAIAVGATALVAFGDLLMPSLLAAAVAASLLYGGALLARQRPPFAEEDRRAGARHVGIALALVLAGLGAGVVVDAGPARVTLLVLLAAAYGVAALGCLRVPQSARAVPLSLARPAPTHGD